MPEAMRRPARTASQRLETLLTEDQKRQFQAMQQGPGPGGPGRGGPPGGPPLFRAYRYALNYPAFAGKDLTPGKTLEEMQPKEPEKKEAEKKNCLLSRIRG